MTAINERINSCYIVVIKKFLIIKIITNEILKKIK